MLVASISVRCGLAMGCVSVGRFRSFELGPFDGLLLIFLFRFGSTDSHHDAVSCNPGRQHPTATFTMTLQIQFLALEDSTSGVQAHSHTQPYVRSRW